MNELGRLYRSQLGSVDDRLLHLDVNRIPLYTPHMTIWYHLCNLRIVDHIVNTDLSILHSKTLLNIHKNLHSVQHYQCIPSNPPKPGKMRMCHQNMGCSFPPVCIHQHNQNHSLCIFLHPATSTTHNQSNIPDLLGNCRILSVYMAHRLQM